MDQILLPLTHAPMSYDTVASNKTKLRLGTSLVMSLVMHSMTGHASAALPSGYEFQNAYLNTGNQPCVPCPRQRTITRSYTYELPQNDTVQIYPHIQQHDQRYFNIGNQGTILFKFF